MDGQDERIRSVEYGIKLSQSRSLCYTWKRGSQKRSTTKRNLSIVFVCLMVMEPTALAQHESHCDSHGSKSSLYNYNISVLKFLPKSSQCEISTSVTRTDDKYKYQCSCRSGYEGNPYLPDGCQDIDECRTIYGVCGKNKCVNVPGSFRCEKTWPAILEHQRYVPLKVDSFLRIKTPLTIRNE
ncbi:hypothetical protein YC2023_111949 [Brassica napus]